MEKNNLELWHKVEKTNPKYTKKAKVGGNEITSIAPQFQIMNVTEQFGSYGSTWGFKEISFDYSLVNLPHVVDVMEGKYPNQQKVGEKMSMLGLVVFKATFFYPNGEFPIMNSISLYTDNARTKIDDNFAKKVETDALTKAISKLGFNADIFLGKFDDVRYLEAVKKEFEEERLEAEKKEQERLFQEFKTNALNEMKSVQSIDDLKTIWSKYKSLQKDDDFIAIKDKRKNELTPSDESK